MARSDVLTLVDDLSLAVTDATEIGVIYDEMVRELGFMELLTSTEVQEVDAGQETVTFADDTVMALDIHTDSFGRVDRTTTNAVRTVYGNQWRSVVGTPLAYVKDHEDENIIRLVPLPEVPDSVTIIRTDVRDDVPLWLELPLALGVLSREMNRESDHQDIKFAMACGGLSKLMFQLLGIAIPGMKVERE